jgi:tRNA (cytidine/uridine-2'-O-)-methyltransferase
MIQLALYQPDIPQNVGSILRLCACLGVPLHIIEPCGFPLHGQRIRAALDYASHATCIRHASWERFIASEAGACRLVLLTTQAKTAHTEFAFAPGDMLLCGRESAGVPQAVHATVSARITIPMVSGMRSLNVAQAAGIALAEALRQTGGFPVQGEEYTQIASRLGYHRPKGGAKRGVWGRLPPTLRLRRV